MLDPLVKVTGSQTVVGFDPKTLLPQRVIQWTFMVGTHGPFTETTPADNFTEQYIEQVTGRIVQTLRAAGALT